MIRAATSLILLLLTAPIRNETVDMRDGGTVDLGTFECRDINRSTVVQRVCYDQAQRALIVGVRGNYIKYCELPAVTFEAFMTAPSMGQFFARNISESGPDGRFACQAQVGDRRPHA
jgi:hypothetical protein